MKYHLVLAVKEGHLKGHSLEHQFMHFDFSADTDLKALAYAKAAHDLKTLDGDPVKFGAYILRKRVFLLFWRVLISWSETT